MANVRQSPRPHRAESILALSAEFVARAERIARLLDFPATLHPGPDDAARRAAARILARVNSALLARIARAR